MPGSLDSNNQFRQHDEYAWQFKLSDKMSRTWAQSLDFIDKIKGDTFDSKAYGCLLGAMLGDACGSFLEFTYTPASADEVAECMAMKGGGPHSSGPGQVTDDSEMAYCLMLGLLDSNCGRAQNDGLQQSVEMPQHRLNEDFLAFRYRDWYRSNPFDIGTTVKASISKLDTPTRELRDDLTLVNRETRAFDVKKTAKRVNKDSKSNGCLMRIAPMAVWMAEVVKDRTSEQYENLKKLVKADVELTHPDKLAQHCCILYCCAIAFLLNN